MTLTTRLDAGRALAEHVAKLPVDDAVVVGLPLGGVAVAFEIARARRWPLDVLIVRTLWPAAGEDFALGAVVEGGVGYYEPDLLVEAGTSPAALKAVAQIELREVNRDVQRWRGAWPAVDVRRKVVFVVDDVVASQERLRAAIVSLRRRGAAGIIIATPIASLAALAELADDADLILCTAIEASAPQHAFRGDTAVTADHVAVLLSRAREWTAETDAHWVA